MARAARMKTASPAVPVPQNDDDARAAIREIGDLSRAVERMQGAMNDQIALLKEDYGNRAAPLLARQEAVRAGLQTWCEANRDRLTGGGKVKHHVFTTGTVSWRLRPPSVTLRGVEAVIETIRALGLGDRFLRTKVEVDKEALRADPAAATQIAGVIVGSAGEDFIVEPSETELIERPA